MNCNDILTGFNVIGRSVVPGATAGDLSLLSGLNTSSLTQLNFRVESFELYPGIVG